MPLTVRQFIAVFSVPFISFLIGCTNDSGSSGNGTSELSTRQQILSARTGGNGKATVTFNSGDATSFQLGATTSRGTIRLSSLTGPTGQAVGTTVDSAADSSTCITNATYVGTLPASGQYTATYTVSGGAGSDVRVVFTGKSDSQPDRGTLKVNLILVGPSAEDNEVQKSLEDALGKWRGWYDSAGITIDSAWYTFRGDDVLPDPRRGDPVYESISSAVRPDAVNLVFSTNVSGMSSMTTGYRFGIPGGSPGPIYPSPKSAIAFSILSLTGPDGTFDGDLINGNSQIHPDETRLAAEEMARLTARYLGIEDIVSFSATRVVYTDHFSDTASCLNVISCKEESDATDNLMFPYPLQRTDAREYSYYSRNQISGQQAAAMNASVFVD